jgi:hypothetical protein
LLLSRMTLCSRFWRQPFLPASQHGQ